MCLNDFYTVTLFYTINKLMWEFQIIVITDYE